MIRDQSSGGQSRWRRLRGGVMLGLGYLLSPLCWWNDVVFNLPIALGIGYGLEWLVPGSWLWGTVGGYWLSNVLGMLLMQYGALDMLNRPRQSRRELLLGLGGSTLYSLVIAALVYWHVLEIPALLLPST
ncbi:MAG: hypothetical protein Q6K70_02270 [Thermostichales cyanobacterium DRC_bins_46]